MCQRGHDRKQQFSLGIESVNVLFLEKHLHTFLLELPDGNKAVDCVSCEAADGLGENEVDFPGKGIFYHSVEAVTLFGVRGGDTLIRIHLDKDPFRVRLNFLRVITDLRVKGVFLFFLCR